MKSTPELSPDQLRELRLRAQRLLGQRTQSASDPAEVVRHLVGVQAQESFAADLSIWVRTRNLTVTAVTKALVDGRTIVRTWCMRGTLHYVAAEDLGWLLPLLGPHFIRQTQARYRQLGLTDQVMPRALKALQEILGDQGPATKAEIIEQLSGRGLPSEGQVVPHLLRHAALSGAVCHGPDRGSKPSYTLLGDWVEVGPQMEREQALAELVRRYLAAFAPAGPEDFAAWSGLNLTDARAAFDALRGELQEVRVEGKPLWTLGTPPPASAKIGDERPHVRLLPNFDTYLLGYRSRDLTVREPYASAVHPGGGIIRPTMLVDGIAAGIWRRGRTKNEMTITLEPFELLPDRIERAIAAKVEDLGRFVGLQTRLVIGNHLSLTA